MNLYDDIAQKMWHTIIGDVTAMQEKGLTLQEIADRLGLKSRSLISEWIHGNRKAENTSFANMLKYISALGYSVYDFLPPTEICLNKGPKDFVLSKYDETPVVYVPICEHFDVKPLDVTQGKKSAQFLPIPANFYKDAMWAVHTSNDSMEPCIKKGAYLGVVPFKGMREGAVCLIQDKSLGFLVRRLKRNAHGLYLHPDNPEYDRMPFTSKEYTIIGDVVWVWQNI